MDILYFLDFLWICLYILNKVFGINWRLFVLCEFLYDNRDCLVEDNWVFEYLEGKCFILGCKEWWNMCRGRNFE